MFPGPPRWVLESGQFSKTKAPKKGERGVVFAPLKNNPVNWAPVPSGVTSPRIAGGRGKPFHFDQLG